MSKDEIMSCFMKNRKNVEKFCAFLLSPSARRAWIDILCITKDTMQMHSALNYWIVYFFRPSVIASSKGRSSTVPSNKSLEKCAHSSSEKSASDLNPNFLASVRNSFSSFVVSNSSRLILRPLKSDLKYSHTMRGLLLSIGRVQGKTLETPPRSTR